MIYRFAGFTLDTDRVELRQGDRPVALERQVFRLLELLAGNGDRLTTRDEIVERIWQGRAISEAAIDSRVRNARAAIGDDGRRQDMIRTVHGEGYRFLPTVVAARAAFAAEQTPRARADERPSIAVLPFGIPGGDPELAIMADALPHEIILQLSRLRWLRVLARGSTFRFRSGGASAADVGESLDARYVVSATLERHGNGLALSVLLHDNRAGDVIWGERFDFRAGDYAEIRTRIASEIVSELDFQIPMNEAMQARSTGTEQLDAWSAYHLGLYHMYRFTASDNARATGLFERAVALDPGFARAHAGLSFTHFQNAFTYYDADRIAAARLAREAAEKAVSLDPRDPFASFVMGRYFWLGGELDSGTEWLERAVALNPNYAQGKYSLAFTDMLAGRVPKAMDGIDDSFRLSPLDPLVYGMFGTRALGHLRLGDTAAAAEWGDRAARSPGAHFLIGLIATVTSELNGDHDKAREWSREIRRLRPDARARHFITTFPMHDDELNARIEQALGRHGF